MSGAYYYFLPSARQGLAASIGAPTNGAQRASVDVTLRPMARIKGSTQSERPPVDPVRTVQLLGPGDILGFHARMVTRTDPKPDVGDFEPNYFPSVEFADADFAWRFTADAATAAGLKPWITLVVLVAESRGDLIKQEFQEEPPAAGNLPRLVKIPDRSVLPKLEHASRWAHVHVAAEPGLDKPAIANVLRESPESAVCRLVCPRRLRPGARYAAFVVPTFRLGVLAGRGLDLDPTVDALTLAWDETTAGDLVLPYYYRWEFQTSVSGDFEHLVRLLEPRSLKGLGVRDMSCATPGFGVAGVVQEGAATETSHLQLEGALKSVDTKWTQWGRDPADQPAGPVPDTQRGLAALIKQPDTTLITNAVLLDVAPTAVISKISANALATCTEVRFVWTTSDPLTSRVQFAGPDDAWRATSDAAFSKTHELTVSGLLPGQRYRFKLDGQRSDGSVAETPVGFFEIPVPAVVPPVYGRWHYGRKLGLNPDAQESWIDVLNLDPRHRVAAGLGAEVVRRQQEALMASAWDQLGAIDEANDVLRRAQFGRESTNWTHQRLGQLPAEQFLGATAAVQRRVVVNDLETGERLTAAAFLSSRSRIPESVMDPAFRHIARPRGPIRRRQKAGRSTNLLTRLATGQLEAAGPPPTPLGMVRLCDISRSLRSSLIPTVTLTADPTTVAPGNKVRLTWASSYGNCVASGGWTGAKKPSGSEVVLIPKPGQTGPGAVVPEVRPGAGLITGGALRPPRPGASVPGVRPSGGEVTGGQARPTGLNPGTPIVRPGAGVLAGGAVDPSATPDPLSLPDIVMFSLTCKGPGGTATASVAVAVTASGSPGIAPPIMQPTPFSPSKWSSASLRFCDEAVTSAQVSTSMANAKPFAGLAGKYDPAVSDKRVRGALDGWLEAPIAKPPQPPIRGSGFATDVRNMVFPLLDPKTTFVVRARKRLQLSAELSRRFVASARGDPLDQIMSAPHFPRPMYEPLRDISHALLLPGVETVPQNTLGVLETNRRFIESYMCGLNHEFAGELLWREYPTDQRGSYFRQFWDVSEYVPRVPELQSSLEEKLRDIAPLVEWKTKRLGANAPASRGQEYTESMVLIIRGQLLQRYPNALIYAVDAVAGDGGRSVPGLAEYLRLEAGTLDASIERFLDRPEVRSPLRDAMATVGINLSRTAAIANQVPGVRWVIRDGPATYELHSKPGVLQVYRSQSERPRILPIFKGSLPPDLSFFGFPFAVADARTGGTGLGKYFVLEERVGEPRFGLDPASTITLETWDDLSWSHFGLGDAYGAYLDQSLLQPVPSADPEDRKWENNASAATRAWITLQRPVRVAVHATQMLP